MSYAGKGKECEECDWDDGIHGGGVARGGGCGLGFWGEDPEDDDDGDLGSVSEKRTYCIWGVSVPCIETGTIFPTIQLYG